MEGLLWFLVNSFGYVGVLLVGFMSSFTLFLPTPAFIVIMAVAGSGLFSPFLVGVLAALGAALGEITGYAAGFGSHLALSKYFNLERELEKMEAQFDRYGAPAIIFVFAFLPLPFDVVGIFCGAVKYSFKKFFVFAFLGLLAKFLLLSYAAFYGGQFLMEWYRGLH